MSDRLQQAKEKAWNENQPLVYIKALEARIAELEAEVERLNKRRAEIDDEAYQYAERIAKLEVIVDKLPKTANGVPVVPGMIVYRPSSDPRDGEYLVTGVSNFAFDDPDGEQAFHAACDDCSPDCDDWRQTKDYYSTPEAARQAKEQDHER